MHGAHLLFELVIVLGSAAVVTVLFQALRLPVVLGYVLAGLVIGPHVPVPLVADVALVHELSELGVILLMFTIGLELPLKTIRRVGVSGALTALFEVALVVAVGTLVARVIGLSPSSAIFAGACLGISSTMLVARAFDELGWKGGFTEIVFAILVFEDLIAIVLLAVVTAVASGKGLDATELARLLAKLGGFLALMLVGGLVIVPRVIRWTASRARRETLVIMSLLVCFGLSALAARAGFSVALGAFIAGVLVAESGHGHTVFALVEEFRDVFAMVFFVSIGMSIDPKVLASEAPLVAAFAIVVLLFKPIGVTIGVLLAGHGINAGVRAGLSLAQIGELSFVIAGALRSQALLAIAVGVSCTTTLVSPLLIRSSERVARWVAGRLPKRLATFGSFYAAWLGRLRQRDRSAWKRFHRTIAVLVIDVAAVVAIVIVGSTLGRQVLTDAGATGSLRVAAQLAVIAVVSLPFGVSMVRRVVVLARRLAVEVIPDGAKVDLGRAARRSLVAAFELALALVIVVVIVATVQPFVPGSFMFLLLVALVLVALLRRSITDFEGHVRAGSELLLELLSGPQAHVTVGTMLPGFGELVTIAIPANASAVGRSLAQLDVRAKTGATVLAIVRGTHGMASPSPSEPLQADDVVALAGSGDAIAAARELLSSPSSA